MGVPCRVGMSFAAAIAWAVVAVLGLLAVAALLWICTSGGQASCGALCGRLCFCCRSREDEPEDAQERSEGPANAARGGSRRGADEELLRDARERVELPNLKNLCPRPPPGLRSGPLYV